MRFAWLPVIGVSLLFLVDAAPESTSDDASPEIQGDLLKSIDNFDEEPGKNTDIPILPPLILLDFSNGTNSSDEKSKRTLEDDLGYGFQENNLFSGKYKYYFPGEKGTTTVSIQESVSPVVPRTIFEIEKPITEKLEDTKPTNVRTSGFPSDNYQLRPKFPTSYQPVFGQRTKLYKNGESFDINSTPRPVAPPGATASFEPVPRANSFASASYATPKPPYDFGGWTPGYSFLSANANSRPRTSTERPGYGQQDFYQLNDYPKITVENGIRYEHRIYWKYPDGRVSENPPPSYPQYPPDSSRVNPESNLYHHGPLQFPKDQENSPKHQTPFITSNRPPKLQNPRQPLNQKTRVLPKYEIASRNPEYISSDKDRQNPTISSEIISRYESQAQKYFGKVLSQEKLADDDSGSQYANLLTGNPSISQYIKNPSSILNARPTFIQAGSSLIPVIILKIDGTPPVQARKTPNVNLKGLLQQYIAQYANSMNDLTREATYELGDPLVELKQLADDLNRHSERSRKVPQDSPRNEQQLRDSYGNVLTPDTYKRPPKVKSVQIIDDSRSY